MSVRGKLVDLSAKFNGLSVRERILVASATLAAVIMTWDIALMSPLAARERALTQELESIQKTMNALAGTQGEDGPDATAAALQQERSVQTALDAANLQLASAASGLIAPERMIEVVQDVLTRQRGIRLISLKNKPVLSLVENVPSDGENPSEASTGPYVHPFELIVEGNYLDVLSYLRELEGLPWRIYWKRLELETLEHPTNRVRIELSTLSMDKAWIGV